MLLVTLATNFLFLFFFQTSFSSLFFASILYHNTQASATLSLRLLLMVLIENIALFDTSMLDIIFSFFFFFCCFSWFTSTRQCIVPRQQHQSQMTWHCYSHGKQTFNLMQYLFQGSDIFRTNLLCINVLLEPNNKFPVRSGFDSY